MNNREGKESRGFLTHLYLSKNYCSDSLLLYPSLAWTFLSHLITCWVLCLPLFCIFFIVIVGVCSVCVWSQKREYVFIKTWPLCFNLQNEDLINGNIFWFSMHWFQVNKCMLFMISRSLRGTPSLQTFFCRQAAPSCFRPSQKHTGAGQTSLVLSLMNACNWTQS